MHVEHSPLLNEFISFWFETRVDDVHRFDWLGREWYTCAAVEGPILIRGNYDPSLSDDATVEFVKAQLDEALAAGRL
jgi:hypothetical protein